MTHAGSVARNTASAVFAGTLTVALAMVGLVATASPADAATPGYRGALAPLAWDGTDYDEIPGQPGNGAVYISPADDFSAVTAFPYGEVTGFSGTSDVHAALLSYDFGDGVQNATIYISEQWFVDQPGGPYSQDCAGLNTGGFGGDSACVAFKTDVLTANGANTDYTFEGLTGFLDDTNSPVSTDPDTLEEDPALAYPTYQGGASPFRFGGTDYVDPFGPGSSSGSAWLPAGGAPNFADDEPIAVPKLPTVLQGGQILPVHIALLDFGGVYGTMAFDGALFHVFDPMNPFSTDCEGFEDFLAMVGQGGIQCVAFRAGVWTPPDAVGEQYTCVSDWYTGWTDESGEPIDPVDEPTTVDGFDPPALTPIGVDTGTGVCGAAVPPTPPQPPAPPNPNGPAGPNAGGDGTGTGTGTGAGTGTIPTLPATGVGTPALALSALALLGAGTAFTLTARRRARRTSPPATGS